MLAFITSTQSNAERFELLHLLAFRQTAAHRLFPYKTHGTPMNFPQYPPGNNMDRLHYEGDIFHADSRREGVLDYQELRIVPILSVLIYVNT